MSMQFKPRGPRSRRNWMRGRINTTFLWPLLSLPVFLFYHIVCPIWLGWCCKRKPSSSSHCCRLISVWFYAVDLFEWAHCPDSQMSAMKVIEVRVGDRMGKTIAASIAASLEEWYWKAKQQGPQAAWTTLIANTNESPKQRSRAVRTRSEQTHEGIMRGEGHSTRIDAHVCYSHLLFQVPSFVSYALTAREWAHVPRTRCWCLNKNR